MRLLASAVLSFSLIASSTAATASTTAPPVAAPNAWMALSMLTPSGAVALEGTAAAVAQPETPPPPPPPPPSAGFPTPPIPVIAVWLAVIALDIWILTKNHGAHHFPNSPA